MPKRSVVRLRCDFLSTCIGERDSDSATLEHPWTYHTAAKVDCRYTPALLTGLTPDDSLLGVHPPPPTAGRGAENPTRPTHSPPPPPLGRVGEVAGRELGRTLSGRWEGTTRKWQRALGFPFYSPSTCAKTRPRMAVRIPICRLPLPHRDRWGE